MKTSIFSTSLTALDLRDAIHVAAQVGYETRLHDVDDAALGHARERIEKSLAKGIERGKLTEEDRRRALENLTLEPRFEAALEDADLMIEAVIENESL
jgi:3-hydroxybutyryl-CoA dehydrogenase